MAALQKIRNQAGLLVVVIGVALLAFIIGDFLNSGSTFFQMSKNNVATVNGNSISIEEFQENLNASSEQLQARGMSHDQANKQIFDEMVMSMASADCAENIGIAVSSSELQELMMGNNLSPIIVQAYGNPQTGEVDKAMLNSYLQQIFASDNMEMTEEQMQMIQVERNRWIELEKAVKEDRINNKMYNLVFKSFLPNDVDLEAAHSETLKNVDFAYVAQLYSAIPDSLVEVSDKELKDLYAKTREKYARDEVRTIDFVSVSIAPTPEDFKAAEEKINSMVDEFTTTQNVAGVLSLNTSVPYRNIYNTISTMAPKMKEFVEGAKVNDVTGPFFENNSYKMYRVMALASRPDSAKVRHIMFSPMQQELCDSVYNVLKKGGDFAKMAKEFSLDAQRTDNGGEFGWLTEPSLVEFGDEFIEAAFGGKKGVQKVTTKFGLHIVEATDVTKPVKKAKVAQLVIDVKASQATRNALYNKVSRYITETGKTDKFSEGDAENGISVQNVKLGQDDMSVAYIPDARELVRWAFNADEDDLSTIMEISNNYVVAKLAKIEEKGYESFEEVSPLLTKQLLQEKKGDKIVELMGEFETLEAAAEKLSLSVDTAKSVVFRAPSIAKIGFEPKLSGAAPYATVGELQAPVKGNRGVYMYKVVNANDVLSTFSKENEVNIYRQNIWNMLYNRQQYFNLIRSISDIEDNRVRFY